MGRMERRVWTKLFILWLNWIWVSTCYGQSVPPDTTTPAKDLIDVLFRQKKPFSEENSKRKVYVSVFPAIGATPATKAAVVIASNAAFYTADPAHTNISVFSYSLAYTLNNQFIFPIRSNVWLKNNKWNLVGDWRFLRYPQETYGLGPRSLRENENRISYGYIRFYQYAMRKIKGSWLVGGGLNYDRHFGVRENWAGPDTSLFRQYPYGTGKVSASYGFGLNLLWDNRKNIINPYKGSFVNVIWRMNPAFMGNKQAWSSVYADIRKYIQLGKHPKRILGCWLLGWFTLSEKTPYLLLPSNGWDTYTNTARGYVQGRYRGRHFICGEFEYRYPISRNGLLSGVVFTNVHTVSADGSLSLTYLNPALGAGLRIKLNKISETNLVIDLAVGRDGSWGIYFDVGEMF